MLEKKLKNKYCFVFYGIGRNSSFVKEIKFYQSIHRNSDFFYFLHKEAEINNPRSKELGIIDYQNLCELPINIINIDMSLYHEKRNLLAHSFDPHEDDKKTLNNLLKQLVMLKNVADYFRDKDNYDVFCLIRDDIKFSVASKLLIKFFKKSAGPVDHVLISAHDWHGGYNDKFFVAGYKNFLTLSRRVLAAEDFIMKFGYLNAEHLLKYVVEQNHLSVKPIFLRVGRVRLNGKVVWDSCFPSISRPLDLIRVVSLFLMKSFKN